MHFPALFSLPDRPRTSSFPGSFTDCILKSAVLCLPCFLFEYWNYSKKTMFSISMLHLVLSVFWFAAVPVFLKFLPILKKKQEKLLWIIQTLLVCSLCIGLWQLKLYSKLRTSLFVSVKTPFVFWGLLGFLTVIQILSSFLRQKHNRS